MNQPDALYRFDICIIVVRVGELVVAGYPEGFYDIAQTLASFFDIPPLSRGQSCLA